jgi:hypothetical protein
VVSWGKIIYKVRSKSTEWKANNLKIYRRKKAKWTIQRNGHQEDKQKKIKQTN